MKRHLLALLLLFVFFLPLLVGIAMEGIAYQQMLCEKIPTGPGAQDCGPEVLVTDHPLWRVVEEGIMDFYNFFQPLFWPPLQLDGFIKSSPTLFAAYVALPEWLEASLMYGCFMLYALTLIELGMWGLTRARSTLKTLRVSKRLF